MAAPIPLTVWCTDEEFAAVCRLMQATGVATPDSILKIALWNQCERSLDEGCPDGCFELSWRLPARTLPVAAPPPPADPDLPPAPASIPEASVTSSPASPDLAPQAAAIPPQTWASHPR